MRSEVQIDWVKLSSAIEFYKAFKWKYIEVPWRVPLDVQSITFPTLGAGDKPKVVGSAEQSFIYLQLNGKLSIGKYMTCTPCFRKEDEYNRLRQPHFMKIELYQNYDVDLYNLNAIVSDAFLTMSRFLGIDDVLATIPTSEGYDIVLNGIEVGSYGIREHDSFSWIYGTGIAEPRFSTALKIGFENDYREPKDLL